MGTANSSSRSKPGAAERRAIRQEIEMKKTITALLAVATVAGSLTVTPAQAQRGWGAGVAAGLIGGAIVGGAIAASRPYPYYYGPPPGYVGGPVGPGCYWQNQRYWDGYAWNVRPVQVCD
jgi:hypothetical protein